MKLSPGWLVGWFFLTLATAWAVERLPIEDFARQPDTSRARLSPDGKSLAFLRDYGTQSMLLVADVDTNKIVRIKFREAALANHARKEVAAFSWIGNERLLVTTSVWDKFYGVLAVDRDGRRYEPISGYEDDKVLWQGHRLFAREVIHRFFDEDQTLLMLDRHEDSPGKVNRPDVLRVKTLEGLASVAVKNPGEVSQWGVDNQGVVRLGILSHGDLSGAIYRGSAQSPWRTLLPLKNRVGKLQVLGFDSAHNQVFVAALTTHRRWSVFSLDPATGSLGEPLLADAEYDVAPTHFIPTVDGLALTAPVFSGNDEKLVGLRYYTDAPRVKWFDGKFSAYQQAVDRALPDTVNLCADISLDGKRMLWFGYSDQNPGGYYLLDAEKHTFKLLAARMSWIKPAQMAPMLAIKYAARDGQTIHGYLTVPVGHEPKHLPLVVMPHGGPWVRDTWGFDPLVQLLANRGYAVLQMNYRGSPGYGEDLYLEARRQIGLKIQDDIEDATRWAIAAGVANPGRIAIFGGSYGGYSALFALGHNPELYRCGISLAGVTDWPAIFDDRRSEPEYKQAYRYWTEQIGNPDTDHEFLRRISPVSFADQIAAPVLIIQGKDDRTVPPEQAKLMIAALKKAGRAPESLFVAHQGHNLANARGRLEIFKRVAAFLEKTLGPGVK
jgi:dipeptidyl aminopeptidase/acylaminoacyl peptidase